MKFPAIACVLTLCVSCNKIYDIIKERQGSGTGCQITTVTDTIFNPSEKVVRMATYRYDSWGNPTSVTYNRRETGFSWSFFTYDAYKRLIQYKDENSVTYQYLYKGLDAQPFGDTLTTVYFDTYAENFTYDSKGRIIRVTGKFIKSLYDGPGSDYEEHYDYNSKGNLVGSYVYDNKVSVYSTNRIWQFLFRNYSVSNLVPAKTYNGKGLPLNFGNAAGLTQRFFEGSFNSASVTYDCK